MEVEGWRRRDGGTAVNIKKTKRRAQIPVAERTSKAVLVFYSLMAILHNETCLAMLLSTQTPQVVPSSSYQDGRGLLSKAS